jgi:hypothetical protein
MNTLKFTTRTSNHLKKKDESKTKKIKSKLFLFLIAHNSISTFAQTSEVTTKLTSWGDDIKLILNMIVGIFAFVGGFLIFIQYMQGNEQAQKNFIRFIIGLAIFGLVALVANMFIPSN